MTTSALICYDSRRHAVALPFVAGLIEAKTEWTVSKTEWTGFGITVPQLMVHTPVPFLIQIENDPTWVPADNLDLGESEGLSKDSELFARLTKCDARLAIQSTEPDQVLSDGTSLTISTLGTAVDPTEPPIAAVLALLAREVDGLLADCVNGGLTHC